MTVSSARFMMWPSERDDREAERVDAAAIVEQVDVVRLVAAQQRAPTPARATARPAARTTSSSSGQAVSARRVERRAAPAVDGELDVAARQAFGAQRLGRSQQLDVRALRRDERAGSRSRASRARRSSRRHATAGRIVRRTPRGRREHAALVGEERRHLLDDVPRAVRFLRTSGPH